MKNTQLLVPNGSPSARILKIAMAIQLLLVIGWWFTSHSIVWPNPVKMVRSFDDLAKNHNLLGELLTSIAMCVKAIGISTLLSLLIVYAGQIPIFSGITWLSTKIRYISMIGITFVMQIYFGGENLKLALLTFGITGFMSISLYKSLKDIKKYERTHARTLGLSPWRELWEVDLYGRRHEILEAVKQNVAIIFVMLSQVEGLVRSGGGIGVMMLVQNKKFDMASIFMMQTLLLLVAILIDYSLGKLKEVTCKYSTLDTHK